MVGRTDADGHGAAQAARLLGVTAGQVRAFVRDGVVRPARGPRGEYRFSFRDLVLLRVARDLGRARVPKRRIRRSLHELKESLPDGDSLTGLRIDVENARVVVDDGERRWNPESRQLHFDFDADRDGPVAAPPARLAPVVREGPPDAFGADDWYDRGCDLEPESYLRARAAYERALEIDPDHFASLVNLGRLLHEAGDTAGAEAHYRRACAVQPDDPTGPFNLGVVLEDSGRLHEALAAYEQALAADPEYADAHYNAAGVCERLDRREDAIEHLKRYRRLRAES